MLVHMKGWLTKAKSETRQLYTTSTRHNRIAKEVDLASKVPFAALECLIQWELSRRNKSEVNIG